LSDDANQHPGTQHEPSDYAAYLNPPLTTISVHASEIGRAAGEHLLARMAGRPTLRATVIEAELIVRGSTAPPWETD